MKGADQCPKCASTRWGDVEQGLTGFYAQRLRVCGNCGTAWEPFEVADLIDAREPLMAFRHPCNNCAFRKGSPEQADKDAWESKMIDLSFGAAFYCHKGVPVLPDSEDGFDYPKTGDGVPMRHKLRLCRGYLNSIVGPALKKFETSAVDANQPPS